MGNSGERRASVAVPQHTRDRDHVAKIAASRPDDALRIARGIDDPWYRCQALPFVAYNCTDIERKSRLLKESFQAAVETREPNRIVTVSWVKLGT